MKIIRQSVFETNSSSTHSISISEGTNYCSISPNEDAAIVVHPGDFGWTPENFTDPESKLSYVMLYIRDWARDHDEESFTAILNKVVCEHTGATSVVLADGDGDYRDGYIDHQSVECHDLDYLFTEENLKNFIFNPSSVLHTDNDNY